MKHGNGWLKGLAVLVCVLVFMGGGYLAGTGLDNQLLDKNGYSYD